MARRMVSNLQDSFLRIKSPPWKSVVVGINIGGPSLIWRKNSATRTTVVGKIKDVMEKICLKDFVPMRYSSFPWVSFPAVDYCKCFL